MRRHMPDWSAIEKAAIAGVPYPALAKRHGVSLAAVKKRASRGKWAVPARIMRRAKELSPNVTGDAVTDAAEQLLEDGNTASVYAMKILLQKLTKAARNPSRIADLADVQDVVASLRGARLAAGLDRAQVNVGLQIGGLFRPSEAAGIVLDAPLSGQQ